MIFTCDGSRFMVIEGCFYFDNGTEWVPVFWWDE